MTAEPLRFTAKLSRTDPRLGLFFYVPATARLDKIARSIKS
jgi:hypothetical protein